MRFENAYCVQEIAEPMVREAVDAVVAVSSR
jgi:hypothetical protein